jgi:hypothetical protein
VARPEGNKIFLAKADLTGLPGMRRKGAGKTASGVSGELWRVLFALPLVLTSGRIKRAGFLAPEVFVRPLRAR